MAFVRTKKILGQDYAYLVENEWTPKGSRQKSSKYLGKIYNIEKKEEAHWIEGEKYEKIVLNLIKQEWDNHDSTGLDLKFGVHGSQFTERSQTTSITTADTKLQTINCKPQTSTTNPVPLVLSGNREVVAKMNEGFLCQHTIKQLLEFKPTRMDKAKQLANHLVEAGIKLNENMFIDLCEKIFPKEKEEKEEVNNEEFYY
ncbi:hypothetical protein HZA97_05915 [Candidatus Woesearchaeota archaeon]|nr:hypothetical protein [Candidatus Woesearchaeota archaeon]